MRKLLSLGLLSLLMLTVSCSSGDTPNEDNSWTGDNLRGKVKSVTEASFQASQQNGEWVKGSLNQTFSVKKYTPEGFITSERRYYTDTNELNAGFDYLYDDEGNAIRINALDPVGNVSGYSNIDERNGKMGILKYTDHFGAKEPNSMATGFTEMDWKDYRLVESRAFHLTGEMITRVIYEYNDRGDISTFTVENKGPEQRDVIIQSTYPSLDEQGNWLQQVKEYKGYPLNEIIERRYEYYE